VVFFVHRDQVFVLGGKKKTVSGNGMRLLQEIFLSRIAFGIFYYSRDFSNPAPQTHSGQRIKAFGRIFLNLEVKNDAL